VLVVGRGFWVFFGWGCSHDGSLLCIANMLSLKLPHLLAIAQTGVEVPVTQEPGPPESGPA
ncbi:hypothetical protein DU191_25850, partial [Salmonella enterica subsp. enterica serovar Sandiego]|nr:hypothetical protein [Salmonella enterica subsp. enterica serovar Sandiego]